MKKILSYLLVLLVAFSMSFSVKAEEESSSELLSDLLESVSNIFDIYFGDGSYDWSSDIDRIVFAVDDGSIETMFTYSDGILELVPGTTSEEKILDEMGVYIILASLYDGEIDEGFSNKLSFISHENENQFNLSDNGIEFKISEEHIEHEVDGEIINEDTITISEFKLDLSRREDIIAIMVESGSGGEPISSPTPKPSSGQTKNPSTGINYKYCYMLIILVLCSLGFIFTKRRSNFMHHN